MLQRGKPARAHWLLYAGEPLLTEAAFGVYASRLRRETLPRALAHHRTGSATRCLPY
ncbi:hypothetical protein [Chlorogloeopsis sp. ULAP02]|uniref:hypothetical protein n=1 Tax=Chlorogloeopsis sp. ULAP02 TaxID=3107926 RepID=UPI00313706F7